MSCKKNSNRKKAHLRRIKKKIRETKALTINKCKDTAKISQSAFSTFQRKLTTSKFTVNSIRFMY